MSDVETVVPEGYQKTKIGVLPSDWQYELLENISTRGSGHTPDKKISAYWNGGIKWVSLTDTFRLDDRWIDKTTKEISTLGIQNSSAVLHPKGTVLISRDASVGRSAIMKEDMAVSQHFITWKCGPTLSNLFLYYSLQFMKQRFEIIAVGSTIKTIGLPFFKKFRIPLPPLPEQQRIATILNTWDEAITKQANLIALKEQRKRGLMQQLLTGAVRFPGFDGEWEEKRLGDVAKVKHGKDQKKIEIENGIYTILGTGGEIGRTNTPLYSKESVLIGRKGTIDKPQYMNEPFWTIDTLFYTQIDLEQVIPKYLYYLFWLINWKKYNEASGVPSLNSSNIEKIKNKFPPLAEQQKIAQILSLADQEIDQLNKQLEALKEQKRGLMQKLLTGQVRVNVA